MQRFSSRNVSEAILPVRRERVWDVVSDPACLAALTPLIDRIEADGDHWCWKLRGIDGLGISVEPSFTERMTFDEPERIAYEPDPPAGATERFGATGTYVLDSLPGDRTRLFIDITLHAELPLPRLARRAVEGVMAKTMDATGKRFAENLYRHLDIDPTDVVLRSPAAA